MRKLTTTLATILALLLVVAPVGASAEVIDVLALQIANPVVYMNGEPMLDMNGLAVQVAGGSTADGSLTQMFLDVFAGGETAASAMLQLDDAGIAGYLGGMQSAYGVSAETLGMMLGASLGVSSLKDPFLSQEDWTLIEDLEALMADFSENGIVYGEPTQIEVDLAAGKTAMTYVPITADATQFMYDMVALLENDSLLGSLFQTELADSGYTSFTDMFKEGGLEYLMTGGIAVTEDGTSVYEELNYTMTLYEETTYGEMVMLLDGSTGDTQILDATIALSEDGEEDQVVGAITGTITGEDISLNGTMGEADDSKEITFAFTYESAAGAGAGMDRFTLTFDAPDEGSFTLSGYASEAGDLHLEIAFQEIDETINAYFTFKPAETAEGAVMSGIVELGATDGEESYALAGDVHLILTQVDTDNFYIDIANVVDLLTMTPEQQEAAETDVGMVLLTTIQKIEQAVPGLAGITAGLMGE